MKSKKIQNKPYTVTHFSPTSNLIKAHIKFIQKQNSEHPAHHLHMAQIFFSVAWFEGKMENILVNALGLPLDYAKLEKICKVSSFDDYEKFFDEMLNIKLSDVLKKDHEGCTKLFKLRNLFAHGSAITSLRKVSDIRKVTIELDSKNLLEDIYGFLIRRKIIEKDEMVKNQGVQLSKHILNQTVANWTWTSVQKWILEILSASLDATEARKLLLQQLS